MHFITRLAASTAALALLATAQPSSPLAARAFAAGNGGPCQVYCDALYSLCVMFKGGYYCNDMRAGCYFGCTLRRM